MSKNMASSDSAEEPNPEDTDQPRDEAEVITSLEYVLAEANRQQDYRRHQVDTSVQLSMQLIGICLPYLSIHRSGGSTRRVLKVRCAVFLVRCCGNRFD